MANEPGGWQSYADFLQLNGEDVQRLQDEAEQRAYGLEGQAADSLGGAYQQASTDLEGGGAGSLTGVASYGDYLKAKREADAVRTSSRVGGSAYETAARGMRAPMAAAYEGRPGQGEFERRLEARRGDRKAGEAAVAADAKRKADELAAQDEAFGKAREDVLKKAESDIAFYNQQRLRGLAGTPDARAANAERPGSYTDTDPRRYAALRARAKAGDYAAQAELDRLSERTWDARRPKSDAEFRAQESFRRGISTFSNLGAPVPTTVSGAGARDPSGTRGPAPTSRTITAGPTKGKQSFKLPF